MPKKSKEIIDDPVEAVETSETEYIHPVTASHMAADADRLEWFRDADRRVKLGFYTMMLAISEIYDNKLYLAAGFHTISDYLNSVDVSRSQFYLCVRTHKYLQAANIRHEDIFCSENEQDITKKGILSNSNKLDLLRQNIDPELFKELFDGRQIDTEAGALDLKEIVEMSVAELKRQFADNNRKRRAEMAQLREELKQERAERSADQRLIDRAREDLRRAEMLKAEWAPMEKTVNDKVIALRATIDYVDRCCRLLKDITVGDDENERVTTEAIHMISAVNFLWGTVQIAFAWVAKEYELGYDPGKLPGAEALDPNWHKYVPSEVAKMDFEIEAEEAAAREAEKLDASVRMTVKRSKKAEAEIDEDDNA
jgi:hypothetical protein